MSCLRHTSPVPALKVATPHYTLNLSGLKPALLPGVAPIDLMPTQLQRDTISLFGLDSQTEPETDNESKIPMAENQLVRIFSSHMLT